MLDIPPITARVDGRIGRTPATRLRIEPVPLGGRPAGFLGGVGDFTVRASVTPGTVMVGQEFEYRIEVAGPAAWGMIARPPLDRLGQLPIAPRVEPLADSETREPATRTFAWRIRPTRPGSVVLPPVAIAAFDPASRRYLTKVSPGTPVRVVATPGPAVDSLSYSLRPDQRGRGAAWAWLAFLTSLVGGAIGLVLLARQQRRRPRTGRRAARTFARDAARRWDGEDGQTPDAATELDVAWRILAELIDYARIGLGRPAGAITPEEAAMVVRQMSGDEELAQEAASLCEGCDRVLFSGNGTREERRLRDGARRLFTALGRAEVSREGGLSETRARTSD